MLINAASTQTAAPAAAGEGAFYEDLVSRAIGQGGKVDVPALVATVQAYAQQDRALGADASAEIADVLKARDPVAAGVFSRGVDEAFAHAPLPKGGTGADRTDRTLAQVRADTALEVRADPSDAPSGDPITGRTDRTLAQVRDNAVSQFQGRQDRWENYGTRMADHEEGPLLSVEKTATLATPLVANTLGAMSGPADDILAFGLVTGTAKVRPVAVGSLPTRTVDDAVVATGEATRRIDSNVVVGELIEAGVKISPETVVQARKLPDG